MFCTLSSQLCADHVDTSTHVDCNAFLKIPECDHTFARSLQLCITWHCVDRVSKLGHLPLKHVPVRVILFHPSYSESI